MIFANWASLLFLGVASAVPLLSETKASESQLVNVQRSILGSSGHQLLPRGDSPSTTLRGSKGKGDKKKKFFTFYIEAANWKADWFKAPTAENKAFKIQSALKTYLKSINKSALMKGQGGGAGGQKKKGSPGVLSLAIGCPGVQDLATATAMRGYIEHILKANTEGTAVTKPNEKQEAAAEAEEDSIPLAEGSDAED